VCVYVPHKNRHRPPFATDVLQQLDALIKSVAPDDCIVVTGDLNCQLRRNVPGCTGQWSMTSRSEDQGHDEQVLDI